VAAIGVGWWAFEKWHTAGPIHGSHVTRLAVLPFRVTGTGAAAEQLSLGIADSIIARLSAVRSLRVRSADAVARYLYGDTNADAARTLDVTYLLHGTARRVANAYEIAAQLRATDGRAVWEDTFTVADGSVMEIEERIADRVVQVLNLRLSDGERARLAHQYTANTAAYEAYLEGRTALLQVREQEVDVAARAFEKALVLDPNYAQAQAGLAMALVRRPWYASSREESDRRYQTAMRAAERASQLDPSLAEAHEALAAVYRYREFEWEHVIQESATALELSPSRDLPYYNLATAFYHLGLFDLSDRAARAGLAINPRTESEAVRNLGRSALYDGRFETAARFLGEAEKSSNDGPRWLLAEAWYYLGEHERSIAALERLERSPQHIMRDRASASLTAVFAAVGNRPAAERRLEVLIAQSSPDHHVSHRIGTAYAQLGSVDQAVGWLRRAAETGFPCYACFDRDPLLRPIRQHPTFLKLLDDLRPMAEFRRSRYASLVPHS
jgi:tetratricopeptide (TPR) repeat protein